MSLAVLPQRGRVIVSARRRAAFWQVRAGHASASCRSYFPSPAVASPPPPFFPLSASRAVLRARAGPETRPDDCVPQAAARTLSEEYRLLHGIGIGIGMPGPGASAAAATDLLLLRRWVGCWLLDGSRMADRRPSRLRWVGLGWVGSLGS